MPCTSSHKHCRSTINPKCSPRIQNLYVRPSIDTFARVPIPESCLNSPRLFSSALYVCLLLCIRVVFMHLSRLSIFVGLLLENPANHFPIKKQSVFLANDTVFLATGRVSIYTDSERLQAHSVST